MRHDEEAVHRDYRSLVVSFLGCDRDMSIHDNLIYAGLGFGCPSFDFVLLRNPHNITSLETAKNVEARELALALKEDDVHNCKLRYFADV